MDYSKNGSLSYDEVVSGYDNNPIFAETLSAMDARREDLDIIFKVLDDDDSGEVTYKEFVEQLHKMKCQDSHTLLVFMRLYIKEIRSNVKRQLEMLKEFMEK